MKSAAFIAAALALAAPQAVFAQGAPAPARPNRRAGFGRAWRRHARAGRPAHGLRRHPRHQLHLRHDQRGGHAASGRRQGHRRGLLQGRLGRLLPDRHHRQDRQGRDPVGRGQTRPALQRLPRGTGPDQAVDPWPGRAWPGLQRDRLRHQPRRAGIGGGVQPRRPQGDRRMGRLRGRARGDQRQFGGRPAGQVDRVHQALRHQDPRQWHQPDPAGPDHRSPARGPARCRAPSFPATTAWWPRPDGKTLFINAYGTREIWRVSLDGRTPKASAKVGFNPDNLRWRRTGTSSSPASSCTPTT